MGLHITAELCIGQAGTWRDKRLGFDPIRPDRGQSTSWGDGAPSESASPRGFRFRAGGRNGVAPRRFKHTFQLRHLDLGERDRRPALLAPSVRHGRERVGRQHALELLLLGRELQIGSAPIRRERGENARRFERDAVEMRRLCCARERKCDSLQVGGGGHARLVYVSKVVFMLRDICTFRPSVAHPGLRREPLMFNPAIWAISPREKHWRSTKARTISKNPSRNDVARLRTFDHYGTRGCAHILYPPVMS